jgi:hypothetical protein
MQTALTNLTTTGSFSYVFRGTGPFDPDVTSTGGQPANYDDWSALYQNYRVWSSSIKVHVLPTTSALEPTAWLVAPRHTATAITAGTFYDAAAMPYAQNKIINVYRAGAPDAIFRSSMTARKFYGLSKTEFEGRDDITAIVSASPTTQWYWHVSAINIDTAITSEVAISVDLVYDIEFFNRTETTLDLRIAAQMNMRLAFEKANSDKLPNKGRCTGQVVSDSANRLLQFWKKTARERKEGKDDFQLV